jgi:hypothetical protein
MTPPSDRADQDYGQMEIFRNIPIPDLTGLRRFPRTAACEPHVVQCGDLVAEDLKCTTAIQEFLTCVPQGFTAYRTIAASAAEIYRNGAEDTVTRIRASCAETAPGLPTLSPAFTDPATEE